MDEKMGQLKVQGSCSNQDNKSLDTRCILVHRILQIHFSKISRKPTLKTTVNDGSTVPIKFSPVLNEGCYIQLSIGTRKINYWKESRRQFHVSSPTTLVGLASQDVAVYFLRNDFIIIPAALFSYYLFVSLTLKCICAFWNSGVFGSRRLLVNCRIQNTSNQNFRFQLTVYLWAR